MQKFELSKFVASCLLLTSLTWAQDRPQGDKGEKGQTLHNGIEVPAEWPPRLAKFPTSVERDAVVPPYLTSPPAVIRIDVGRQLFVDDFLIADTTLTRTFHQPVYHPACPVLTPDRPWEGSQAMPFSDGVWHDPQDQLFKIWYKTSSATCYATSRDGIKWDKPLLDVKQGTNVVVPGGRDSSTVWLDHQEKDPERRFKMFRGGELRVEVLDEGGAVIAPFTRAACVPVRGDKTLQEVRWEGIEDISKLARKPVRFRFHLTNGRLYSFWVSPDASGASHGYVAAGGPGLTGPTDTVGAAGYRR